MKRLLALILTFILSFAVLGTLTACSKKECEECGKTSGVKTVSFLGEKFDLCKDCNFLSR